MIRTIQQRNLKRFFYDAYFMLSKGQEGLESLGGLYPVGIGPRRVRAPPRKKYPSAIP